MFVGRETELEALGKLYGKDKFQMVVMYGRRRVGKTSLIKEFIKDKPAIFFSGQEANDRLNMVMFSEKVYAFFGLPEATGAFASWQSALMFIAERAKAERFILVIDEFPYIAQANRSVKSILQSIIDHKLLGTNLFLILCGSQVGFMEDEVLGHKSPLFGRRTAQFRLEGFDYYDAAKMLPLATAEEKVKYYACVGGTPHYLAQIDGGMDFEGNIKELFFQPHGYLYDEPAMLLKQELRQPAMYNSILAAIATGSSRLNDVSTKLGEDTAKTIKYIKTLMGLRILSSVHPFGENPERSRKGIYAISDHCFRFWYRYVFMHKTVIESGAGADAADSLVFPGLPAYVGKPAFEEVCMQYIVRRNKDRRLPFLATGFGKWWGTDPRTRASADIDVIADNKHEKKVIAGECKWRNEPTGAADINKLFDKIRLLPGYEEYRFVFFSKSPFTDDAKEIARSRGDLELVTLGMLYDAVCGPQIRNSEFGIRD